MKVSAKNKVFSLLLTSVAFTMLVVQVGCSSSKKSEDEDILNEPEVKHEFKLDYEVIEASETVVPKWIKKPSMVDSEEKRKNYTYYINESENVNLRLCEKSAVARAASHIGGEISQFLKNTYTEGVSGGSRGEVVDEVSTYADEKLTQDIEANIFGATLVKKYWEKRVLKSDDDKEGKKDVKYKCYSVLRMSLKDTEKAIELAKNKLMNAQKTFEAKNQVETLLKGAGKKFQEANLNKGESQVEN